MGERTHNSKLTARTPLSFKEEVEDLRTALQRERRWLYCGEKISLEAIVNVAVLEFLRMDPARRAELIQGRIGEIEAMFEAEDRETENPAERGAGEEGKPLNGGGRIRTIPGSPPPARKGRGRKAGG